VDGRPWHGGMGARPADAVTRTAFNTVVSAMPGMEIAAIGGLERQPALTNTGLAAPARRGRQAAAAP
jgi:hypothetical protein